MEELCNVTFKTKSLQSKKALIWIFSIQYEFRKTVWCLNMNVGWMCAEYSKC